MQTSRFVRVVERLRARIMDLPDNFGVECRLPEGQRGERISRIAAGRRIERGVSPNVARKVRLKCASETSAIREVRDVRWLSEGAVHRGSSAEHPAIARFYSAHRVLSRRVRPVTALLANHSLTSWSACL
jgi:hypothetical protein